MTPRLVVAALALGACVLGIAAPASADHVADPCTGLVLGIVWNCDVNHDGTTDRIEVRSGGTILAIGFLAQGVNPPATNSLYVLVPAAAAGVTAGVTFVGGWTNFNLLVETPLGYQTVWVRSDGSSTVIVCLGGLLDNGC